MGLGAGRGALWIASVLGHLSSVIGLIHQHKLNSYLYILKKQKTWH